MQNSKTKTNAKPTLRSSYFLPYLFFIFFVMSQLRTHNRNYLAKTPHFLSPSFFPRTYHPILLRNQKGYGSMGLQTHHTHPRTSLHNRLNRRPPRETPVKTPLTDLPGKNYVFNYSKYTMVGPSILT